MNDNKPASKRPPKSYIEGFVQDFLKTGSHGVMYKMMLSENQWNAARRHLNARGLRLVEGGIGSKKTMTLAHSPIAMRDAKRAEIKKRYPALDDYTVNGMLGIPMSALGAARVVSALQYSRKQYKTTHQDFYGAHYEIQNMDNDFNVRFLPAWTFVSRYDYDFSSPAYVIGANIDINAPLVRDMNNLLADDVWNVIKGYKIPSMNQYYNVLYSHSPMLIFLNRRDAQIEQKICDITAPHVRSQDGIIGTPLGSGLFITPNPINGEPWYHTAVEILRILRGENTR